MHINPYRLSGVVRRGSGTLSVLRPHSRCLGAACVRLLLFLLVLGWADCAVAQVSWSGPKKGDYYINDYKDKKILHKHSKWYDFRDQVDEGSKAQDSFNDELKMFTTSGNHLIPDFPIDSIQAAHTYIDTIYMHRGQTVRLVVPDFLGNALSARSYQRWYSFRTDRTFQTQTGNDDVVDLLTPAAGKKQFYRFDNGYIAKPLNKDYNPNTLLKTDFYYPTREEFKAWFPHASVDDHWFVVACDVSSYKDFTETFTSGQRGWFDKINDKLDDNTKFYEPTLTHRVLFYIASVDDRNSPEDGETEMWLNGHGRLKNPAYQGGTEDEGKKYLEEYEITFPATRLNGRQNEKSNALASDAVSLSKDAYSYAIPYLNDKAKKDITTLSVKWGENNGELSNLTTTVTAAKRLIQFDYPESKLGHGIKAVPDSTRATILVTKTVDGVTYNIARYKLLFLDRVTLLTQSIVDTLDSKSFDASKKPYSTWAKYRNFTPKALDNSDYKLLTSLDFDYSEDVRKGLAMYDLKDRRNRYYPFPMNWDYSSYAFFDGSKENDYEYKDKDFLPQWGYYGITSDYTEEGVDTPKNPSGGTYHLYIDASDRPGNVARLLFKENLCQGSELFVSAWIKEAGLASSGAGAGMLMTIVGIDENGKSHPMYRYNTGQVRRTDNLNKNIPGCGNKKNEWMHLFFSFINKGNVDYESYALQLDNNSLSTEGGDFYIDDVRVYLAQPSATVVQLVASCEGDSTLLSMKLDWNRLLSRTGGKGGIKDKDGKDMSNISFVIVDKNKYESALNSSKSNVVDAIKASVVKLSSGNNKYDKVQLHYYTKFTDNRQYKKGESLAELNMVNVGGTSRGAFYSSDADGEQNLAVDFYGDLKPNRPYLMIISDDFGATRLPDYNSFKSAEDPCGVKTEFYVTGLNEVWVEGELFDPTNDEYCVNQQLNFEVKMRYPTGEKDADGNQIYKYITDPVKFDWFFGTLEEYDMENNKFGNETLRNALLKFREAYPTSSTLEEPKGVFTQDMYDLLKYYIEDSIPDEGRHNRKLTLYKENLDIRLLKSGLNLVVTPVKQEISVDKETYTCWSPTAITISVRDGAPTVQLGFNGIAYPKNNSDGTIFAANVRLGLHQIKAANDADNSMRLNLRKPTFVTQTADRLGPIDTMHESRRFIYLLDTNDPEMKAFVDNNDDRYGLPIGKVDELEALRQADQGKVDFVKLHFDLEGILAEEIGNTSGFKFKPREGYWYSFNVGFEERNSTASAGNSCYGVLHIKMLVVPEYLEWTNKTGNDNWSNDSNWRRIPNKTELNKPDSDKYPEDGNTTTQAYVPMHFSKVVMADNSKVQLYPAGYDQDKNWKTTNSINPPTENIQYDLLVVENKDKRMESQMFRTYWIDKILFKPGVEMLHPEYLIYNRAWIDYRLEPNKWLSLASPLQGVVAGDFYTGNKDKDYEDKNELFTPITFAKNQNSRTDPAVYQRGWDMGAAEHKPLNSSINNVALKGTWSGLFNDVDAKDDYLPGHGFSLKVMKNEAVFRLPKDDKTYSYYDKDGNVSGSSKNIARGNYAYRLITDTLFERKPYHYGDSGKGQPIIVTLKGQDKNNGYFLVGNPYMSGLDMNAFFKENSSLTGQYWQSDGNAGTPDFSTNVSTGNVISPLRSFFVKLKDGESAKEVKFTQDMQVLTSAVTTIAAKTPLRITATDAGGHSTVAVVAFDEGASEGFVDNEDAELFIDNSNGDLPRVYTVGGNYALSVNRTAGRHIPLGTVGSTGSGLTLRFDNVTANGNPQLYDAQLKTSTPLTDGFTLTVDANSAGRYYLLGASATNVPMSDVTDNDVSVYSVRTGEITVTSLVGLKIVRVYNKDGSLVTLSDLPENATSTTLDVPQRSTYIVNAVAVDGTKKIVKIAVR